MKNIELLCTLRKHDFEDMLSEFTRATKYNNLYVNPSKVLENVNVDQYEMLRDAFGNVHKILSPLFKDDDVIGLMKHHSFMGDVAWLLKNYRSKSRFHYSVSDKELIEKHGLRPEPDYDNDLKHLQSGASDGNKISKADYHKLSKKLHPDAGGDAESFAILNKLYDKKISSRAEAKADYKIWREERSSLDKKVSKKKKSKDIKTLHKNIQKIKDYK